MRAWLAQHRRALGLALRRLADSPLNTLLSVLAIGVALALPAGGQMLLSNAVKLARNVAPTPQVSLFMAIEADAKALADIEARLKRHEGVKSHEFVAKDKTLARMKAAQGLGEVIEALPRNPFPDAFVIAPGDESPEAMEKLAAEFRKWPRVEHVQLDSAWVRRLDALLRLGHTGVLLLAALLGVGLVAITFNTIRLQVLTHRAEIEVSRLLGATDAFTRRPFFYFGALQGLLGGAAAWLIVLGAVALLGTPLGDLAKLYSLEFALNALDLRDTLALLGLSAFLGWAGAALSLRQHLDGDGGD